MTNSRRARSHLFVQGIPPLCGHPTIARGGHFVCPFLLRVKRGHTKEASRNLYTLGWGGVFGLMVFINSSQFSQFFLFRGPDDSRTAIPGRPSFLPFFFVFWNFSQHSESDVNFGQQTTGVNSSTPRRLRGSVKTSKAQTGIDAYYTYYTHSRADSTHIHVFGVFLLVLLETPSASKSVCTGWWGIFFLHRRGLLAEKGKTQKFKKKWMIRLVHTLREILPSALNRISLKGYLCMGVP